MDDQTPDNLNVCVIDVNNNITDNNADLDNAGTVGHNTVHGVNMPGPYEYKDGATASSSSLPRRHEDDRPPPQNYQHVQFHEVPVPVGADATTRALFAAINQTNYLIFAQGERLRALEDDRRPPRRHRRPQSPPPRQADEHPRSPSWRQNWEISRSPSPQPIGQRPSLEREPLVDAGRRDHGPSRQERRPSGDRHGGNYQRSHRSRNALRDQDHRD